MGVVLAKVGVASKFLRAQQSTNTESAAAQGRLQPPSNSAYLLSIVLSHVRFLLNLSSLCVLIPDVRRV
jgi:hypothetical protein